MKDLISNCFLCGEKSLHVAGKEESQVMQCINCGYTTTSRLTGTKETNEEFQKLGEDMKKWAKEENGYVWIPTVMALPVGMLYPIDVKGEMKWSFAEMVEIPEDERKNYPNPQGGFYDKRVDTENSNLYDNFISGISVVNELLKKQSDSPKIKLPKLKKDK